MAKPSCRLLSVLDKAPRTLVHQLERLVGIAVITGVIGGIAGLGLVNAPVMTREGRTYDAILMSADGETSIQISHRSVITQIAARDGDRVDVGQVLFGLDTSVAQHDARLARRILLAAEVRKARLEAELAGETGFVSPSGDESDLRLIVQVERLMLESRRRSRAQELDHARQRLQEMQALANDLRTGLGDAERLVGQHETEVGALAEMVRQNAVAVSQIVAARAQATAAREARQQVRDRLAQTEADVAQAMGAIAAVEENFRARIEEEVRETDNQIRAALLDVRRAETSLPAPVVEAPVRGVVRLRRPLQVGETIQGGEVIAVVARTSDTHLVIQVKNAPERSLAGRDVTIEVPLGGSIIRIDGSVVQAAAGHSMIAGGTTPIVMRAQSSLPTAFYDDPRPRQVRIVLSEPRSAMPGMQWISDQIEKLQAGRP